MAKPPGGLTVFFLIKGGFSRSKKGGRISWRKFFNFFWISYDMVNEKKYFYPEISEIDFSGKTEIKILAEKLDNGCVYD